jgi:hypothetical protein
MEKSMARTRDWRRAQKNRYKKHVWNYLKHRYSNLDKPNSVAYSGIWVDKQGIERRIATWQDVFESRTQQVNYSVNNRQMCSKQCCGNPRKWFGQIKIQERKFTYDI